MMAARNKAINKYITANPGTSKFEALSKLVCYTSAQAHCSVQRAGLLNLLPAKSLPVNDKFELTGETLEAAILKDIAEGKIPFYSFQSIGISSIRPCTQNTDQVLKLVIVNALCILEFFSSASDRSALADT
ncbi:unnamed protein product [Rodentolepis nana]|uniref:Aromatic-L-amino-acid decarboxylase n=1 Tax=Rodentolepis nana TaxID=102285 RepID=A0A0R3TGY1_RODNA|nr:unnamed protein product [Rodentolepis nana]